MTADAASQITVLNNGATVVTRTVPSAKNADIFIRVDAGARDEIGAITRYPNGTAHGLEHMLFCGSEAYPDRLRVALAKALKLPVGEEANNVTLNAATRRGSIVFMSIVKNEAAYRILDVELAAISKPAFTDQNWAAEKGPILNEWLAGEMHHDRLHMRVAPYIAYGKNPALYPAMGDAEGIKSLTPAHLRDFHAEHFRAGRVQVYVEGNIRHDAIVETVRNGLDLPTGRSPVRSAPYYEGGDVRFASPLPGTNVEVAFDAPQFLSPQGGRAFQALANLLVMDGPHSLPTALRTGPAELYHSEVGTVALPDRSLLTVSFQSFSGKVSASLETIRDQLYRLSENVDLVTYSNWRQGELKRAEKPKTIKLFGTWAMANDMDAFGEIRSVAYHAQQNLDVQPADIRAAARDLLSRPVTFVAEGDLTDVPSAREISAMFGTTRTAKIASSRPAWDSDTPRRDAGLTH